MYDPNRQYPFVQSPSMIVHADRRPNVDHASRMIIRRARQRERTAGFTQTDPNKFDEAINLMIVALSAEYKKEGIIRSNMDIRTEAIQKCRAALPKTPLGVRVKPYRSRSKY